MTIVDLSRGIGVSLLQLVVNKITAVVVASIFFPLILALASIFGTKTKRARVPL